jgi:hypothetical protein
MNRGANRDLMARVHANSFQNATRCFRNQEDYPRLGEDADNDDKGNQHPKAGIKSGRVRERADHHTRLRRVAVTSFNRASRLSETSAGSLTHIPGLVSIWPFRASTPIGLPSGRKTNLQLGPAAVGTEEGNFAAVGSG